MRIDVAINVYGKTRDVGDSGCSAIFVSHDMPSTAATRFRRMIWLKDGQNLIDSHVGEAARAISPDQWRAGFGPGSNL